MQFPILPISLILIDPFSKYNRTLLTTLTPNSSLISNNISMLKYLLDARFYNE